MGRSPVVVGDSFQALCQPAPSGATCDKSGARAARASASVAGSATPAYHVCGLMLGRHGACFVGSPIARAAIAAVITLVIGHSPLSASGAFAQAQPQRTGTTEPRATGTPALGFEADPHRPPSPAATMLAYKLVEPWVRAWSVPPEGEAVKAADEAGRPLPPVYGACINLRLHGQLIGRGQSLAFEAGARPDPVHIVRAAAAAIADADPRLPVANDLNRGAAIRVLTPDIQISLELAGSPTLITDDTWALVDTGLAPGLDGLACRAGKGEAEVSFPSEMMMSNLLPQRAVRGMIANTIGEGGAAEALLAPKLIRDKHTITIAKFRVSHLAQCAPEREPEFLNRGARVVAGPCLDRAGLEELAWGLASHLRARASTTIERAPETLLLDTISVDSYARLRPQRFTEQQRTAYLTRVRDLLSGEPSGTDLTNRALRLAAPLPSAKADSLDKVRALAVVEAALDAAAADKPIDVSTVPEDLRAQVASIRLTALDPVQRSVVLFGYGRYCAGANRTDHLPALNREIRRVFADLPTERLVSLMPWLGWSELDAATIAQPDQAKPGEVPAAPALRQMRAEVWKHQLSPIDAGADGADMVGGIVFTTGASIPFPTWQTVRPIAFIATMVGDDRLTEPAEREIELYRVLAAFRFLRQLQVDDSCGWMCPNPEAAIGGIRAATWDQSMPPDATSLALLATCELFKSMDRMAAARAAKTGPADKPSGAR